MLVHKMMKKNKKAQIYSMGLVGLEIFLLTTAFILLSQIENFDNYVGEVQNYLIEEQKSTESELFFLENAAEISLQESLGKISAAGFLINSKGSYLGSNYWIKEDENYIEDENIIENLNYYFSEEFSEFTSKSDYIHIPAQAYNLQITSSGIRATTDDIEVSLAYSYETEESVREYGDDSSGVVDLETIPNVDYSTAYTLDEYQTRDTSKVDKIILHHTGDSSARQTYTTLKSRGLSVHYIIDRDGTIYYAVDEQYLAYHAKGYNTGSIGIEIVNTGYADMEYTEAQYESVKELIVDIASRWPNISVDNEHVLGHFEADDRGWKWDPSPNFDWSMIGLPDHPTSAYTQDGEKRDLSEYGYE